MDTYGDLVGQLLGQYRLVQPIGQGGFSEVYLGRHTSLNTVAAIKVLHTKLSDEEKEQFLDQARTFSQLDHPHIVRILDFGIEDELPFLVMDYAPNGSVRHLYPRGTRLPLTTIVLYVKQIADALQYIHDHNLIHRDIKPHNMLFGPNYEVMLSDFNIAVVSQSMGYRKQKIQEFEGTILYAAPEQIQGRPRTASDQYALGVVVYEWLSGTWPFQGTVEEIASQHTLTPPPPLSEKAPFISSAVEQVVLQSLAKSPNDRFASVQEFASLLERASRLDRPSSPHILSPITPLPIKPSENEDLAPVLQAQPTLVTYCGHTDKIHSLAWSPQTPVSGLRIASSSLDETVQVWDATTGTNLLTYRNNSLQAQTVAWSPNGKFIASTGGLLSEIVQIWDASTGQPSSEYAEYHGHTEQIQALAWSLDGQFIASASDDGTVHVWDVRSGKHIFTYRNHSLHITSLAWLPTGPLATPGQASRIVSGSEDKTVQVWNALTGSNILVYYAHLDKVNALTCSPGGTHIASASNDGTVQVWDASSGRRALTYAGHTGGVTSVSWSPDGICIASSGLDETVQVWNAINGNTIFTYPNHSDWVSKVAWSPDGKRLASGSWDKTIQVWEIPKLLHLPSA